MWNRWKQTNLKEIDEQWFNRSFLEQMVEVEGEVEKILRDEIKLQMIRTDMEYVGEPQIIQHIFEIIKNDPKNREKLFEIEVAERKTYAFLCGDENACSKEELEEFWYNYLKLFIESKIK